MSTLIDNSIKARKERARQAEFVRVPPFPREIFLDLTSYCNHTCVFCSNPRLKHKATMPKDMVHRVLQEAYDCGVRDLAFYATGESFLV